MLKHRRGHPAAGRYVDLVEATGFTGDGLGLGKGDDGHTGAGKRTAPGKADGPYQPVVPGSAGARHLDYIADMKAMGGGRAHVDSRLTWPCRKTALGGLEDLERSGFGPGHIGEAGRPQRLSSSIEDRGTGNYLPVGLGHPRDVAHLVQHGCRHGRDLGRIVVAQRGAGSDHDRLTRVGGADEFGVRGVDGVGEDVGAGHKRDAERHRNGGQDDAEFVGR